MNIQAALQRAFRPADEVAAPKPPSKPSVRKGGLDIVFHVSVGESLSCLAVAPSGLLAAATAEGDVVFVDGAGAASRAASDRMQARCEALDDAPNAMAFVSDAASSALVAVSDDGHARVIDSGSGEVILEHLVAEELVAGKRSRCVAADHVISLSDGFAAAAGRLVHACTLPEGRLEHALPVDAPIRALCAAPPGAAPAGWAYAAAHKGGVLLVSRPGEILRMLASPQPLRSLGSSDRWLAAAAFDGSVELWDVATASVGGPPAHRLQAYCGSDGASVHWSADGGGMALTGVRAAIFDFTGANPPHPYRRGAGPLGQPDPVPRVCMDDAPAQFAQWAPHRERGVATTLATVSKDGVVRLWQPRGLPLRKGGKGNPAQPHLMKPQFYTFLKHDAAHPSGDAVSACALVWLGEDIVAAGYTSGDIVAWRLPDAAV